MTAKSTMNLSDICFVFFLQATGKVHTIADSALWDELHHIRFYSRKYKNRAKAGLWPHSWVVSGISLDLIILTSCKNTKVGRKCLRVRVTGNSLGLILGLLLRWHHCLMMCCKSAEGHKKISYTAMSHTRNGSWILNKMNYWYYRDMVCRIWACNVLSHINMLLSLLNSLINNQFDCILYFSISIKIRMCVVLFLMVKWIRLSYMVLTLCKLLLPVLGFRGCCALLFPEWRGKKKAKQTQWWMNKKIYPQT